MKKENKKVMLWAVVTLIVGLIIGMLLTNFVTTGHAVKLINPEYSLKEIQKHSKITHLENGVTKYDFCINSNGQIIDYKADVGGNKCMCHRGACSCGDRCVTRLYHPGEQIPWYVEWSTCMQDFIPSSEYYKDYEYYEHEE